MSCHFLDLTMGFRRFLWPVVYINDLYEIEIILNCLSIGTPETINFPFVPNGKLMGFRCSIM